MKVNFRFLFIILIIFIFTGCATSQPQKNHTTSQRPAPSVANPTEIKQKSESVISASNSQMNVASPSDDSTIEGTDAQSDPDDSDDSLLSNDGQAQLDEALDHCQASQEFWQKGELDNALEELDQAYALILNVDAESNEKLAQQKEDLRFLVSKRILEIYASRNNVVTGNYNAIPITLNKHVQAEIQKFTAGNEKSFFANAYKRSGKYRPQIVAALEEAGLPTELSWLPLIESGYNVVALSPARALGLWQFIPSTGYKFGLKRDLHIDERMDSFKSTQAAIAYLKELHQMFGDWTTVLAAYNCGEGRVMRTIRDQNVNYLDDFWDLYGKLPAETARYVPRFLATLQIVKNPKKYGLDSIDIDCPTEFETIEVSKQFHLRDIAKSIGTDEKLLKDLNPELRHGILPPESYTLKVPAGTGATLTAALDSLQTCSLPQAQAQRPIQNLKYHKVKSGESLSSIARKYNVSLAQIARANRIKSNKRIVAGRSIKIPVRGSASSASKNSVPRKQSLRHVVKRGDSLWNIANRYGTTTQKIQKSNKLSGTSLHVGQVLSIPTADDAGSTQNFASKTYKVKRGDTPFTIAQKNNMSLNRFLQINRLTPKSKIFPGQKFSVE
ncbi:MAG: LysM peptidoglycan-binding domain-containing protein [Desulfobacterales bacterium]|nr:LysM peptidoglycan-binding domain-containing protein [Desulfobacterales bacterium]